MKAAKSRGSGVRSIGTTLALHGPGGDPMSDDEEKLADSVPAKSGNKILPIMLVVNTLLLTGVLIFVMKRPSAQAASSNRDHAEKSSGADHEEHAEKSEGAEHTAEGEGPGPTLRLDNFIVQIRGAEGDRYAHLTIEVEVGAETDKKSFETRMPRIRDTVIGYLSDRSEDELRGSEGLGQMKAALTKKIDEIVPGHRIRGLFTTEFIIQ
jgi:flagellar FliL protein